MKWSLRIKSRNKLMKVNVSRTETKSKTKQNRTRYCRNTLRRNEFTSIFPSMTCCWCLPTPTHQPPMDMNKGVHTNWQEILTLGRLHLMIIATSMYPYALVQFTTLQFIRSLCKWVNILNSNDDHKLL